MSHHLVTHSLITSASALDHVRVDGVSRTFADRRVLTNVSFVVARDARVGLIGENGAGKSTLLRIVAGVERADMGAVETPARVGLLRQEFPFPVHVRVGMVLDDALRESSAAEDEVEQAGAAVAEGQAGAAGRFERALVQADLADAWTASARRASVVAGLGLEAIEDYVVVSELSGGQRSRLALAALLLARPTALLLDEPTNHLDDGAVAFLQRALSDWPGPVLFASHDRAFLDQTATRIVDLDPTPIPLAAVVTGDDPSTDAGSGYGVQSSRGGYSRYLEQRQAQQERWRRQYQLEQEELADLRRQVDVTARTTNTKTSPRTEARIAKKFYADRDAKVTSRKVRNAAARLTALEDSQVREPSPVLAFAGMPPSSADTAAGPLLCASAVEVAGRLATTTLTVDHGQKILVTGQNGAGKSTLLNVLNGTLTTTSGTIQRADSVTTALLTQDVAFDDPTLSPRQVYDHALGPERAQVRPLVDLGLVADRDLDRQVGALSVGQQRRLALALVIADPPSVLLLDEPTNHLSLALAEELEHALDAHAGAVVLASHDRWLRRRWQGDAFDLQPITQPSRSRTRRKDQP